ncbi:MAG: tetratricopeptide repeat protein [Armatimonadia bacterium]|nr:tetratricopeptide repeat protein [Armatimonadia bacterium]
MDAQGAEVARPYHEAADAEFTTVVDQHGRFGSLYSLRAVPFGVWIDENGIIVRPPHNINVGDEETLEKLSDWIAGEGVTFGGAAPTRDNSDPAIREADLRFELGSLLLEQNQPEEALEEWRHALKLDPENWIIHKQIWAVENPSAFYDGNVDYDWQRAQLQREGTE